MQLVVAETVERGGFQSLERFAFRPSDLRSRENLHVHNSRAIPRRGNWDKTKVSLIQY